MFRVGVAALAADVLLTAATAVPASPIWAVAPAVPLTRGASYASLRDVSVVSPSEVWVVGYWRDNRPHPLSSRWNGAAWTTVPTPDSPDITTTYVLNSIDAVTGSDVWAAGGIVQASNPEKATPLFLHYNGAEWIQTPGPTGVTGQVADVDLLTADEGWAVGTDVGLPFILRRGGGRWHSVPVPILEGAFLESVHATSSRDAWAVGHRKSNGRKTAVVLQWDGAMWHDVTVPDLPDSETMLVNVATASASDVWAVGSRCAASLCQPWVLHLAGGVWRTEQTAPGAVLTSVVAFAPDDVWVVGQAEGPEGGALDHVEHWDGTGFTPDPNVPPVAGLPHHPGSARTLAAASGHHPTRSLWAVGWTENNQKTAHAIYSYGPNS